MTIQDLPPELVRLILDDVEGMSLADRNAVNELQALGAELGVDMNGTSRRLPREGEEESAETTNADLRRLQTSSTRDQLRSS